MDCPACHHPNVDGARFCAKCGAPCPPAPSSEADPLIGTLVGDRYRITGILGEGGMGIVYNAEQSMGTSVRKVAVKTLLEQFAKDPQTYARFMRECGTVSELEHPNTIKVYDFGKTPKGDLYIAMELLTGVSVEKALESGPFAPERLDRIMGQVCGSLQEAHDKGIVHRDLKPANIQLSTRAGEADYVKVLDFGIAKRSEAKDAKQEQKLTQQGTILGTPPYMSPEQFMGKELDARSDIYSLGVIAYEMLTGRLPFDADTPWQWATQHMTAQPFPFETIPLAAGVPPKMKAAIMRALNKDREKRQQTVREFFDELTLGNTRLSMAAQSATPSFPDVSAPGGTAMMPSMSMQQRPGQTQVGQPVFAAMSPGPAGRTMVDQPAMSPLTGQQQQYQQPYPQAAPAHVSASTGSGQAYPPPAPSHSKKGGMGALVGVGALLGVLALGTVAFIVFRKSGTTVDSDDAGLIALPGTVTTIADAEPPSVSDAGLAETPDAGLDAGKKTIPTPKDTGGPAVPPGDAAANAACEAAINLANGGNTTIAVTKYRSCKGAKQSAALAAIDGSARRKVASSGCAGKEHADAAASVGAPGARNSLPRNCRR
jgi:serine/threonine-protein kinase